MDLAEKVRPATTLLRIPEILRRTGHKRATFYAYVTRGLMPKPIRIGERAGALPDYEVDAVNAARIRGATDDEIRALVQRLQAARVAA